MTLIINNHDVEQVLTMEATIAALELFDLRAAFDLVNRVLDIVPDQGDLAPELGAWVDERVAARADARRRRDFGAADAIRKELEERGIAIEDSPQGTRWKKVQ